MHTMTKKKALVIGVAGAIAISAANPSWAAPVSSNTATVKEAAPSDVIDVNHRRWGRYAAGAVALGVLGAGAYHYYGPPHPYYYSHYGPPYEDCWRYRGRWVCDY